MKSARPLRQVMRRRHFERIYEMLAKPTSDRSPRVFGTIKELLCFAAFLGFAQDRRVPFEKSDILDDIQEQIFAKDDDALRAILLIGLAHAGTIDIFHPDRTDELVRAFEEYANGGMEIIAQWIDDHPTDLSGHDAIIRGLREKELLPAAREENQRKEPSF